MQTAGPRLSAATARRPILLATAALFALAGCGRSTALDGPPTVAEAAEQAQVALHSRQTACGLDGTPFPLQALQPRMPERDTAACRDAAFQYERALLDLVQARHRAER